MKPLAFIVEDSPEFLAGAKGILLGIGYDVIFATNLQDAEELWEERREGITLVILDHNLGDENTYELAVTIHASSPDAFVISASTDPGKNKALHEAGLCNIGLSRKALPELKEEIENIAAMH